ncbi:MAG: hypothetical protein WCK02_00885 [Bacteroidota bacterium]
MRKYLVLLLLLFFIEFSFGQSFNAGLLGGFTASQVSGDDYSGFNKLGFTFGAYTYLPLKNEKSNIGLEIFFIQKGSRHLPNTEKFDYTDYAIRLSYIEIPIIYTHQMPVNGLNLEIGSAYARLISQKEVLNYVTFNNPFNDTEIDFIAGFKYAISERIDLGLRNYTTWFFSPIRAHSGAAKYRFNWGQYNTALSFSIRYNFAK